MTAFKKNHSHFAVLFFLTLLIICLYPQIVLAKLQPLKNIRVGAYDNPPKIYLNNSGDTVGIFPAVLEVIAEQEGWQIEYVHGTWEQCLQRLERGSIDIMVDVASSKDREEMFSFSTENVILNWGTIYTKKNFTAESFLDLRDKTIAIVKEDIHTVGDNGIVRLADKFELNLRYLPVDSYKEALEMVNEGKADAGVVNRMYGTVSQNEFEINKSPIVFNPVELKFAFSRTKKTIVFAQQIDYYLNKFKKNPDSVFHKIINSYLAGVEYDFTSYHEIKPFKLSETQLAWLRDHQTIRLGVDKDYAPYSYIDQKGVYHGLAIDIINLIAEHLGLNIEIVEGLGWQQTLDGARKRTLDAVLTTVETPERKSYLNFTQIYLATPLVIMTREGNDRIEGPEDLAGIKTSLVNGYSSSDRVLQEHPDIQPLMVQAPLKALTAVSVGKADCTIGVLGVNDYLIRKNGISNLKVAARYDMLLNGQRVGVRKDWHELTIILDKAFESIAEKKKVELYQTWISSKAILEGPAALQDKNTLSAEETVWVKKHKKILLGVDPEFAPFEFFDKNGEYAGIASEYIKILNKRLGLDMQVVPNLTWREAVQKVENREIDVLPCVSKTEERQEFLGFSDPYMNYSRVIITRSDTPFISSIDDIRRLRVAVQKGTSHEGYLSENTEIEPILYPTLIAALKAVSAGKADAFVGNLSSSIYWLRKENLTNLKVAGPVTYSSEYLHFAVRKDWPQLVKIIDKGLSSITPAKDKRIREKWVNVEYDPGLNPKIIFRYIAQGVAMIVLILLAIVLWNYRLKREIRRREALENALNEHQDKLEQQIENRTADLSKANTQLIKEINDRKQMEKEKEMLDLQLLQAQKMESIGTLAGGIAHDFNNILSGILGYSQLAQTHLENPDKARTYIKQLVAGAHRATELTRQILTFSRQTEYQKKPFRIYLEVNEALKLLRSSIPSTIEIKKKLESRELVAADPTKIHQLIMNLCTNAYHAMRETGGSLTVSLTDVVILELKYLKNKKIPPGEYVMLEVSDTGYGMDETTLERAFDPYYTTKKIGHGTGLGLSLVQAIVEEHDAFIEVHSKPDKGTRFLIYFPIVKEYLQNDRPEIKNESQLMGNETIMLVDDEESIREVCKNNLEYYGYNVFLFENGIEALKAFKADMNKFDLLITDMTMPELTGDKLSLEILKIKSDMPIILCTGFSDTISKSKAIEIGIKKYVQKPVENKKLVTLIREIFTSHLKKTLTI